MIDMKKSKRILYWGNIKFIILIQNWGGGGDIKIIMLLVLN